MKLYRIHNKATGKFFAQWYVRPTRAQWTPQGTFFRDIDTIKKHISYLCADWVPARKKGRYCTVHGFRKTKRRWDRLENFEVVISTVSLAGEKTITATSLFEG